MIAKFLYCIVVCISLVNAQENAGTSIAKSLQQCYNTTEYKKFNTPPATINILIDLIRKSEEGKSTQDARVVSYQLLHRFRQDGIRRFRSKEDNPYILAYSPTNFQKNKNALILETLIPGDAKNFPNETLSPLEQCTFHFLISNTIITTKRDDEEYTCPKVGRYTNRLRRDVGASDVEAVDTSKSRSIIPTEESNCPIEYGVIYTRWGPIQAGTVLAGIASAFEVVHKSVDDNLEIDSRYAVTLAGDIVEAALYQAKDTVKVGAQGTWNSTLIPSYYFIQKDDDRKYQFTDAEIRAGMDGIILALKIDEIKRKYNGVKVSQILDMYYSRRGVYSKDLRACNRKSLYSNLVSIDTLKEQAIAFAKIYDTKATFLYTPTDENIKIFTEGAINAFVNYLSTINDLECNAIDSDIPNRVATDLVIVLDTNWRYEVIHGALAELVNEIDVDRFGSNITIINGMDGKVILESTNNRLDFYEKYNLTVHQQHPSGFNYGNSFNNVEKLIKSKLNQDKTDHVIGGRSIIVLFVPVGVPASNDYSMISSKKDNFRTYLPDIKILVLGQASKESYQILVSNTAADVYTLPDALEEITIRGSARTLAARIKQIPRVIRNSECGSDWQDAKESRSIDQYVEIGTANYYKIAPQYFHGAGDHTIKIRGQGYGQLSVCYDRDFSKIYNNNNVINNGNCKMVNSDEFSLKLSCNNDNSVESCQPFYFAVNSSLTSNNRCADKNCRSPDYIKYIISTESFTCESGSMQISLHFTLITFVFFVIIKQLC